MKNSTIILSILFCFLISCQDSQTKTELEELKNQEKIETQNIEVVKRSFEEFNINKDIHLYDELFNPQYKFYSPSLSLNPTSLEELKEWSKILIQAFPDFKYSIKNIFADGEFVVVWVVLSGTHEGEYYGMPATGNKVELSAIIISKLLNGKIVEDVQESNRLDFMRQLGMEVQINKPSK